MKRLLLLLLILAPAALAQTAQYISLKIEPVPYGFTVRLDFYDVSGSLGSVTTRIDANEAEKLVDISSLNIGPQNNGVYMIVNSPVAESPAKIFLPDFLPPKISTALYVNGYANTLTPTLGVNTDEDARCRYATTISNDPKGYDVMPDSTTTAFGLTHRWVLSGQFIEGQAYTYYIRCRDRSGNRNSQDFPLSFVVDLTPPALGWTRTPPAKTNDITPRYAGTATDALSNVDDVEFRYKLLSGSAWSSWTNVDVFVPAKSVAFSFALPQLQDGEYVVEVRAHDIGSGEWSPALPHTFILDNQPPTRRDGAPSGYVRITPTLSLNTDEDATCKYASADMSYDAMPFVFTTTGLTAHAQLLGPTDGLYRYHVRCMDVATTKNSDDYLIAFIADTAAPSITLTTLPADATTDTRPMYKGHADDALSDVTSIRYRYKPSASAWEGVSWTQLPASFSCTPCRADIDKDGSVTQSDLAYVNACSGLSGNHCTGADMDGNSVIDAADAACVTGTIGQSCTLPTSNEFTFTMPATGSLPDGSYDVQIEAKDAGSLLTKTLSDQFTVDTTPPLVSTITVEYDTGKVRTSAYKTRLSRPVVSFSTNEAATCRMASSDQTYDGMTAQCSANGLAQQCTPPDAFSGDGLKTLYVACSDALGNRHGAADNVEISVEYDATGPPVSVGHSPAAPTSLDQITVMATSSASDLVGINLYVDGVLTSCSSGTCSVTGGPYSVLSSHTYRAVARDDVGNEASDPASGTKTFTIVNTPPSMDSVAAFPAKVKAGDRITMTVQGAGDVDGQAVRLVCGDAPNPTMAASCVGTPSSSQPTCSFAAPWTDDGTKTVHCRAYDGVAYSAEQMTEIVSDNTGPSVTTSHDPTSPTSLDHVSFKASAPAADLATITLYVDGLSVKVCGANADLFNPGSSDAPQTCVFTGGPYSVLSSHTYDALAADDVGNREAAGPKTTTVINTPPVLGGASVAPETAKAGTVLVVTASGADDADGQQLMLVCSDVPSPTMTANKCKGAAQSPPAQPSCSFASVWTDDGSKTMYCRAYDGVEYSSDQSFSVTADNTPPSTQLVSVGGDASPAYFDNQDDGATDIVVTGEAGMACKYYPADSAYLSASGTACTTSDTQATCAIPSLAGTSYSGSISCTDGAGNGQSSSQNLDIAWKTCLAYMDPSSGRCEQECGANSACQNIAPGGALSACGASLPYFQDICTASCQSVDKDMVCKSSASPLAGATNPYSGWGCTADAPCNDHAANQCIPAASGPSLELCTAACGYTPCPSGCVNGACVNSVTETIAPSGAWQNANFAIPITDEPRSDLDEDSCTYAVGSLQSGLWTTTKSASRPCNTPVSITVGSAGDCRNEGRNACRITVSAKNRAGIGSSASALYSIDWTPPAYDTPAFALSNCTILQDNNCFVRQGNTPKVTVRHTDATSTPMLMYLALTKNGCTPGTCAAGSEIRSFVNTDTRALADDQSYINNNYLAVNGASCTETGGCMGSAAKFLWMMSAGSGEGNFKIFTKSVDQAWNDNGWTDTGKWITIDNTPPSLTLSSIEGDTAAPYYDNSYNYQTVIVVNGEAGMTCRYYGVCDCMYSIYSGSGCSTSGTQATCAIDTTSGSYTGSVSCVDSIGNANTAVNNLDVSWIVDYYAPYTTLVSVEGDTVSPYYDTSDNGQTAVVINGEADMACRYAPSYVSYASMTGSCATSGTQAMCSIPSSSGAYAYYYACADAAGNPEGTKPISWTVDYTPPTSGIYSVEGDESAPYYDTANQGQTAIYLAFDETGTSCRFSASNVPYASMSSICTSTTIWNGQATIPVAACYVYVSPAGPYTYYTACADAAGNTEATKAVSWTNDFTAPVLSGGLPAGTVSSSTTLGVTTGEPATCKYATTYGVDYDTNAQAPTALGTSHSWPLTGLASGSKTYYVRCRDVAGNKNTADYAITFTVDATPPTVSPVTYSGTCNTGDTITLQCLAQDAEQADNTLSVKVWAGTCSATSCYSTRSWDTYNGVAMTAPSQADGQPFTIAWVVSQPVGTTLAATCHATDRALQDSNWGDAYPLCTIGGCANPPSFSSISVTPNPAKAETVTITFVSNKDLAGNPAVTIKPAGSATSYAATFVSKASSTYTYTFTVTSTHADGLADVQVTGSDNSNCQGSSFGSFIIKKCTCSSGACCDGCYYRDATTTCGYSSWRCAGDCQKVRDVYKCTGASDSCPATDMGDDFANVGAGYHCSGGAETATGYCASSAAYCSANTQKTDRYECNGLGSCNQLDYSDATNCDLSDGWYDTASTQWVSSGACTEKEQRQQEYRDFSCSTGNCVYSATSTRWVDTGNTRAKSTSTSCGTQSCSAGYTGSCTLYCTTGGACQTSCSLSCCGNAGTNVGSGTCCSGLTKCADSICRASCSCDDSNACTSSDTYLADGSCKGTANTNACTASNGCSGTCSAGSCSTSYQKCADSVCRSSCSCDDGNACTTNDVYTSGGYCAGSPLTGGACTAGNSCSGTCSNGGCVSDYQHCNDGSCRTTCECDDGNPCTYPDYIQSNGACSGDPSYSGSCLFGGSCWSYCAWGSCQNPCWGDTYCDSSGSCVSNYYYSDPYSGGWYYY